MVEVKKSTLWGGMVLAFVIVVALIVIIVLLAMESPSSAETPPSGPTAEPMAFGAACKPLAEVCEKSASGAYALTCYYSTAADFLNYNNWRCYLGRSAYGHFNNLDANPEPGDPNPEPGDPEHDPVLWNKKELCGDNGGQNPGSERPANPDTYYPHCWEIDWFADKNGLLNGQLPEDYIWNAGAGWFEDPTSGFVSYSAGCRNLDKVVGEADGLVELRAFKVPELDDEALGDGAPLFKVAAPRLESRQSFSEGGIFLIDVDHIPAECGVWPAFWLLGGPESWGTSYPNTRQDWPNYGEIDIIEQVNSDPKNHTTLHTKEGCTIRGSVSSGGTLESDDCAFENSYTGCSIKFPDFSSQNADRNGVYVCEWIPNKEINYWFFPKGSIPAGLAGASEYGASVDPAGWDSQTPFWSKMDLSGGCSQDFFTNMRMVINTTFCGDWAGRDPGEDCDFNTPEECNQTIQKFIEDYKPYEPIPDYTWRINSVRVYQRCA